MQYRIWVVVNPPHQATYFTVPNVEEAIKRIDQIDKLVPWSESLVYGLECWDEDLNDWFEWYNDDGDSIMELNG